MLSFASAAGGCGGAGTIDSFQVEVVAADGYPKVGWTVTLRQHGETDPLGSATTSENGTAILGEVPDTAFQIIASEPTCNLTPSADPTCSTTATHEIGVTDTVVTVDASSADAGEVGETVDLPETNPSVTPAVVSDSGSFKAKNDDGYTWSVDYDVSTTGWTFDHAEAPPSKTMATVGFASTFSITNTTSGRQAAHPDFTIYLLYNKKSPVCQAYPDGFKELGGAGAYCLLQLGMSNDVNDMATDTDMAPDETREVSQDESQTSLKNPIEIDETDALMDSFNKPAGFMIGLGFMTSPDECRYELDGHGDLLNGGVYVSDRQICARMTG